MKGSISEFELGVLRARMLDAARAKARRGELRISVPIGYVWHREIGLGFDPDLRIQEAIRQIFQRFRQLGSARQVHLAMTADQVHFPRPSDGKKLVTFDWTPIRYRNVISVLKNPFYAGAYAYGKSEKRTEIVDGRARKSYGHGKPLEEWEVLLEGSSRGIHRLGGVRSQPGPARLERLWPGRRPKVRARRTGLLAGLLTCGRCGRRLAVAYTGRGRAGRSIAATPQPDAGTAPVSGIWRRTHRGGDRAGVPARGGADGDRGCAGSGAEADGTQDERRRIAELELQQARYEASLAERRYAACDPDNRLIAAQLEKSWEAALQRVEACEARLDALARPGPSRCLTCRTGRGSRGGLERARRDDALPPAASARPDRGHHR